MSRFYDARVRRVEGHDCALLLEDDLITLYINGGLFVNLRRKFRQYLMVSASNSESKSFLKSTAQIRSEESRHLKKYYHMIHPFSEARVTWEMIMIVVYFGLFILMPVEFGPPVTPPLVVYSKFLFDIISFVDIALFFCTGYYDVRTHKVIMSPKKVFKHYIFSYFFLDFFSSLPYNMYIFLTEKYDLTQMKFMFLLKLARLPTLIEYLRKFCIRLDIWSYKLSTLNFLLWFFTLIWWATAGTYMVYIMIHGYTPDYFKENPDIFNPILDSCFQIVREFMLVGVSEIHELQILPMLFNVQCLLIGSVLNMVILAQVMQIYKRRSNARNKYDNLIQQIDEYMKYKELPTPLRNKVSRYVDFKFQKNIFKETDVCSTLSKILNQDVLLHNCKRLVERVEFLKGLPPALILRIVTKLRTEIYLPNDVIVQAGYPGNAMYFIYMGTVAVYTSTSMEICHLEDGSHFGEISLIINEPRVASVIAVTDCEVFRLSRKDFLEAVEPYPALCDKIRESALQRLRNTQRVLTEN